MITDACTMQMLISAMESQTTQSDGICELTAECRIQLMDGSSLAFQQTSRVRAVTLARLFDCIEGVDLAAYIYKLCIQIYKETKSIEAWDHPAGTRTLFIQQSNSFYLSLIDFHISTSWLNNIINNFKTVVLVYSYLAHIHPGFQQKTLSWFNSVF